LIGGSRLARAVTGLAAIAAAFVLAGCNADTISQVPARALAPVSSALVAEMDRKQMPLQSPILIRIFKEEAELEVWKKDTSGNYALLKTYPICRWSGDLGPKIKEGDRQAPEGFYQITPGLMNPRSNFYLAFNLGFPNAYDRANGRTGAFLMVHGDCSSAGCYAMTDEQIGEIFALGRESFAGGQKSFQVQAFPFRMTPQNMAKHRNSPHLAFWRMIKQGYDHFEVTRQEPRVDVCERRYVFDAESPNGAPLSFNARSQCPAYRVAPAIASLVSEKQANDERQYADLVARNVPTAPSRTGIDGGMNPTFAARLKPKSLLDGVFADNKTVVGAQPGTMGNNVVPPADVQTQIANAGAPNDQGSLSQGAPVQAASYAAAPAQPAQQPQRPAATTRTASAEQPKQEAKPSRLQRLGAMIGLRGSRSAAPAETKPAATTVVAKPAPAAESPAPRQQVAQAPAVTFSGTGIIGGGAAPLSSASFDSRFGAPR